MGSTPNLTSHHCHLIHLTVVNMQGCNELINYSWVLVGDLEIVHVPYNCALTSDFH